MAIIVTKNSTLFSANGVFVEILDYKMYLLDTKEVKKTFPDKKTVARPKRPGLGMWSRGQGKIS